MFRKFKVFLTCTRILLDGNSNCVCVYVQLLFFCRGVVCLLFFVCLASVVLTNMTKNYTESSKFQP